jgi:hypothetical protein
MPGCLSRASWKPCLMETGHQCFSPPCSKGPLFESTVLGSVEGSKPQFLFQPQL